MRIQDEDALNAAQHAAHLAVLQGRLAVALDGTGFDGLVIAAGRPRLAFLDDQSYPFRPNPHFSWWVPGEVAAGSVLLVRPGHRPHLLVPRCEDFWHQPPVPPSGAWTSAFDIEEFDDAGTWPSALVCDNRTWAYIGEESPGLDVSRFGAVNPPRVLARLHEQRVRKTPHEVGRLRLASRRGALGHIAALRAFRDGASEFEIHRAFLGGCGAREQELPYNAIVALNGHGAVLHHQTLDRHAPARLRTLLIDAGAPCDGYGSDITRTWAAEGEVEFPGVIRRMWRLQNSLARDIRPGCDWVALHLRCHELIGELLAELGLWRGSPESCVGLGVTRSFMPHGLGHLLGLQVHDVAGRLPDPDGPPRLPPAGHEFLRLTRTLESGFVVTLEPGLYFIPMLLDRLRSTAEAKLVDWPMVERLRTCGGVRIEDNLVVTPEGHENLTRDAFAASAPP
ncbi:MAG: hypothetical protein RL026_1385 [Pseudomonadota bacterium]